MKGKNSQGTSQERVLIVDGRESITEALRAILEPRYQVTATHEGLKALELILATDYDLIVSEIILPSMNGIELYHEVKRKRAGLEKKMLFIPGSPEERFRGFLKETGNLFLPKPFSLMEFLEAVNRFFTTYQLTSYHSEPTGSRRAQPSQDGRL